MYEIPWSLCILIFVTEIDLSGFQFCLSFVEFLKDDNTTLNTLYIQTFFRIMCVFNSDMGRI